jgi:hypothetical protein
MNILDTSGLDYMSKASRTTNAEVFLTPDIREEYEAEYETKLPDNFHDIFETEFVDKAEFIKSYKAMLNKHGGRSFYNMTGFGDISILALLAERKVAALSTLLPPEEIIVVTGDDGLIKRIRREFPTDNSAFGAHITVVSPETFFA